MCTYTRNMTLFSFLTMNVHTNTIVTQKSKNSQRGIRISQVILIYIFLYHESKTCLKELYSLYRKEHPVSLVPSLAWGTTSINRWDVIWCFYCVYLSTLFIDFNPHLAPAFNWFDLEESAVLTSSDCMTTRTGGLLFIRRSTTSLLVLLLLSFGGIVAAPCDEAPPWLHWRKNTHTSMYQLSRLRPHCNGLASNPARALRCKSSLPSPLPLIGSTSSRTCRHTHTQYPCPQFWAPSHNLYTKYTFYLLHMLYIVWTVMDVNCNLTGWRGVHLWSGNFSYSNTFVLFFFYRATVQNRNLFDINTITYTIITMYYLDPLNLSPSSITETIHNNQLIIKLIDLKI